MLLQRTMVARKVAEGEPLAVETNHPDDQKSEEVIIRQLLEDDPMFAHLVGFGGC